MGTPFFVFSGGIAARGKGLPSASRLRAGRVPPAPAACGPLTLPTLCGGGAAARPASPCGSVREMWRPRPRLRRVLVKLAASRCAGAPLRKARPRQAAFGGPCFAPPPRRLRRRCSGAARPPLVGGFGAVRPSGPVGGAPASLASPATPAAQVVPRGSAYALAARRSGAAALAAFSGQAGPRPAACGLAPAGARNLYRRAHWRRKRRLLAHSRAAGRGERRLRAGVPAVAPAGKAKASPAQGGKPPTSGGLACQCPGQRWANVAGVPPSGGSPALFSFWGLGGVCRVVCCRLSCLSCWPGLVAGLSSWWCLWLVAVPACPVALALCTGGGFCLSAGGGVPWAFLACWCFCRSAGGCSVRVAAPLWVLSLAADPGRSGPERRQI